MTAMRAEERTFRDWAVETPESEWDVLAADPLSIEPVERGVDIAVAVESIDSSEEVVKGAVGPDECVVVEVGSGEPSAVLASSVFVACGEDTTVAGSPDVNEETGEVVGVGVCVADEDVLTTVWVTP
jgi:hypothetical protein